MFRASLLVLALVALASLGLLHCPVAAVAASPQVPALDNPDRACENCHEDIYVRYQRTPMAQGSGFATDGLIEGGFTHAASGVQYRLFLRDGHAWMAYDRTVPHTGSPLHGEQLLSYFIGSGHRGRTYLFQQDGLWFEAPVNYYSKKKLWDMAPSHLSDRSMPDTLPVDPNCLHCHAGEVQPSLPEARNKYAAAPFMAAGVPCAACHGDPSQHLAQNGHGPILNPSKLTPAKRDSVCLQCHLEGDAAIYLQGKSLAAFQPGDDLSQFVVYFVNANRPEGGGRAVSQYEALLRSACKRASGDKLTCTTCHDPHGSPPEAERVSFYRSKCLACHTGEKIAVEHHPEQQDCAVCHMPTRSTTDISHEQLTNHDIERHSRPPRNMEAGQGIELLPVGGMPAGNRELGLAYAQFAERGDQPSGEKAMSLLKKAEQQGAADAEVHMHLGFLDQISGDRRAAQAEYSAALIKNPDDTAALANLAVLEASAGNNHAAIQLLEKLITVDPGETVAGLNLAFLQCSLGEKTKALETLQRLQQFNPDSPPLHQFLETGRYGSQTCKLR